MQIKDNTGASWDWPDYQPHISITRNLDGIDPTKIAPYTGEIVFGPEQFEEVKPNAMEAVVEDAMWAKRR